MMIYIFHQPGLDRLAPRRWTFLELWENRHLNVALAINSLGQSTITQPSAFIQIIWDKMKGQGKYGQILYLLTARASG
jgi:hypothetical protein